MEKPSITFCPTWESNSEPLISRVWDHEAKANAAVILDTYYLAKNNLIYFIIYFLFFS